MDLFIVYDSDGGGTRRIAESLAEAASAEAAEVTLKTVDRATSDDVASAGALLVGCGVNVKVPFGGARTHQMARLGQSIATSGRHTCRSLLRLFVDQGPLWTTSRLMIYTRR